LDDDVYFSEPQEVTTFHDEEKDMKTVKPVKRVVVKDVEHNMNQNESKLGHWGLPEGVKVEDLMGFE
jgi:hypothetical protein